MGYTRYWYATGKQFTDEFIEKVKKIVAAAENDGIRICGSMGDGEPYYDHEVIAMNGDAAKNEDYETFAIEENLNENIPGINPGFGFCKTARNPYDCVVNAVLQLAKKEGYVKKISSDGENDEEHAKRLLEAAE
jgi:hypothetical protein